MTSQDRPLHPAAAWVWAFLSVVWWFISFALALPLARFVPQVGALRTDLAAVLAINGAASLVGVQLLGSALLGRALRRPGVGLLVPLVGVILAIAVELTLHEWAEARFGHYDSELIWWTAALSPTLIVTGVASFGALVAPRDALVPPLVGLALAVTAVMLIVASNVPGLGDGIDAASWPLASLVGASAVYAVAAAIGARRAIGRRS
jgi:hypothetical protein